MNQKIRLPQHTFIFAAFSLLFAVLTLDADAEIHPEEPIIQALIDMHQGHMISAQEHLQPLLKQDPKFKLAHILHNATLNSSVDAPFNFESLALSDPELFAEAQQRLKWSALSQSLADKLPATLIKPDKNHPFIVFADLDLSRVFLFKQDSEGKLTLEHNFYASGGKQGTRKQVRGDLRTPLGVYQITSRLYDDQLPDKYGPFAFPINYPNQWDLIHKRTGGGIWLHGVTSETYSRPPLDSEGCVALPNPDLRVLEPYLQIGVPVILGENETWVETASLMQTQTELLMRLEAWRQDWKSLDNDNYLTHYAPSFKTKKHNIKSWSKYKRSVNASKTYIQVEVDEPVIYGYPGEENMVQIDFVQSYSSDNYTGKALKRQYWQKQSDGQWRITYEGTLKAL